MYGQMKYVPAQGPRLSNIIYNNNGSGRDSYIYGNNGGNTTYSFPRAQNQPASIRLGGGGLSACAVRYTSVGCKGVEARPTRYVQNGSGRDSYISHNDGGFSSPS